VKPDVVLMDIVMPNKNGVEATMEILEKLPNTKIIACTTVAQASMVMTAISAGCANYLVKPFQKQDLLSTIDKALANE